MYEEKAPNLSDFVLSAENFTGPIEIQHREFLQSWNYLNSYKKS